MLNSRLGLRHAEMVNACLKKWKVKNQAIDCIASHGQTVFHAPAHQHPEDPIHTTLQIGDGDHIAQKTGIITISDFRQKHIAAGGEGAPLAVYGDYLLFTKKGRNRILLNLGGIANFTYLPASAKANEVFVTDTGPANTLLDQYTQKYFPGLFFDKDSKISKSGACNEKLLNCLLSDSFFDLPFPKTTGPEFFNLEYVQKRQQQSGAVNTSHEDVMATLTHFSAQSIANAILETTGKKKDVEIYVSGGGAHNPLLMELLRQKLVHYSILPLANLGIHGDAKEAILFATLANEALAGGKIDYGKRSKIPSVSFGKISFPD
jgi:anhydro-N-acetylmuramic acid kinase